MPEQVYLEELKKKKMWATHWAHNEDSDQTGRMPRLIWVFAGRTGQIVGFAMRQLVDIFFFFFNVVFWVVLSLEGRAGRCAGCLLVCPRFYYYYYYYYFTFISLPLGARGGLWSLFLALPGDLFIVLYWRTLQSQHLDNDLIFIFITGTNVIIFSVY